MTDFSPKRASETEVFTVDFTPLLAPGATIQSAVWLIIAVDGVDAQASSMLVGGAAISGNLVSQMIRGGVPGVRYAPTCTAIDNKGQTLVLPEYGHGYLDVTL